MGKNSNMKYETPKDPANGGTYGARRDPEGSRQGGTYGARRESKDLPDFFACPACPVVAQQHFGVKSAGLFGVF